LHAGPTNAILSLAEWQCEVRRARAAS